MEEPRKGQFEMSPELLGDSQTISWPSASPTGASELGRAICDELERELENATEPATAIRTDGRGTDVVARWTDALEFLALLRSSESRVISHSPAPGTLEKFPWLTENHRADQGEQSTSEEATNPYQYSSLMDHLNFNPYLTFGNLSKTVGIPIIVRGAGYGSTNVDRGAPLTATVITAFEHFAPGRAWGSDPVENDQRPPISAAMPRLAGALRGGLINGQGLPRPGARRLRYVDDVPDESSEAEQIGFGRAGDPPADMYRRTRS
jgi:hypothetical protein